MSDPDRQHRHPPDPPLISVAALSRVLGELSPDWQISVEDPASLHIFDDRGNPLGYLDVSNARVVLVDGIGSGP